MSRTVLRLIQAFARVDLHGHMLDVEAFQKHPLDRLQGLRAVAVRRAVPAVAAFGVVETVADLDGQLGASLEIKALVDEEVAAQERRRRCQGLAERLMNDEVPVDEAVAVDEERADHHEEDDG